MKIAFILASLACALLLNSCADQSLMTDEEYKNARGPAPYSPDPMTHVPVQSERPYGY